MKTILEVINLGEDYLKKRGIERARREAEELIAEVLNTQRISLYLDFEKPLSEKELEKCRQYFKRRGMREPFQYISGFVSFANVHIKVNPDVLIPRPETELLVTKIASELTSELLEGKVLWDMCCGSGCIGISLKKSFPQLRVVLSDISSKALAIAKENALANGVEVEILEGDMFSPMRNYQVDYFVSNPPYVSEEEYTKLSPEILQYEPSLAFLAGVDGLSFYQTLAIQLPLYLKERAWIEIGSNQKESVLKLFQNKNLKNCFIDKDWSGKDRFLYINI